MPTSVSEQIKILAELQKIDSEIHDLQKLLQEQPAHEKAFEAEIEKRKGVLKQGEQILKEAQLKQKEKEMDMGSREEKIKKLQSQLFTLKSNKEYSAMELEIKSAKADNSLIEDDVINLIDTVDNAKKSIAKEKENFAIEEKRIKSELDKVKSEGAKRASDCGALEEKRKQFIPNLEPKLLAQYERLLKGLEGLAIVPIVNAACGGCHMGLRAQALNEIQSQSDKLFTCESCARILYHAS